MNSLIFHPLHVVIEQHKANQDAKWNKDYSWVNWPTNVPATASEPLTDLAVKIQKRDGTNFIGQYMGMIAEWDGSTSVYKPATDSKGNPIFGGTGTMIPNAKPQGIMMFSATSGELLKWISYEDFRDIFVLKIKPEYPK